MTLILIDCENFSHNCVAELFAAYEVGLNTHAHGFCDFSISQSWTKELFLKYNITPHQVFHANKYKNAADMALARFAMERIYAGGYSELVIASSDSDFCDLMLFAKSKGLRVVCYASNALINPNLKLACTELKECKTIAKNSEKPKAAEQQPKQQPKQPPKEPAQEPKQSNVVLSNIERNASKLQKEFHNHFGDGCKVEVFVAKMRKKRLISKSKSGVALWKDLEKIGLKVRKNRLYAICETAAQAAPSSTQDALNTPNISENSPLLGKLPTAQQNQPEANISEIPPLLGKLGIDELFEREIFSHKYRLEHFAILLRKSGFNVPLANQAEWFMQNGFSVFYDDKLLKIYPNDALENGDFTPEFRSKISAKIEQNAAQLQRDFASTYDNFLHTRARQITQNQNSGGFFASVKKRLFGHDALAECEAKLRKISELFWQLAYRSECDCEQLMQRLKSEQIEPELIDEIGLVRRQKAGKWMLQAGNLPRPFCIEEYSQRLHSNLLASNLQPYVPKPPQVASALAPANSSTSMSDEQPSSEAVAPSIHQAVISEDAARMLRAFAPIAQALFALDCKHLGTNVQNICDYFKALGIDILSELKPEDLELLGFTFGQANHIKAPAELFAQSAYFEHRNELSARLHALANAYATTLSQHKGWLHVFIKHLKNQNLLLANFTNAQAVAYLRLFGFEIDEASRKIFPQGSDLSDLEVKNMQPIFVLKNYSLAVQNGADINELQRAAMQACLVGESSSVKADYLLASCMEKRFEPLKINKTLLAAKAFLELLCVLHPACRSKIACEKIIGKDKLQLLVDNKFIKIEQLCADEVVFLCCEYLDENTLHSAVICEYLRRFYAKHCERAEADLAALLGLFDSRASEHGGLLLAFIDCAEEILGADSLLVKTCRLQILGFEISEQKPQFIAKPGEQPCALAPSQQQLEAIAASTLAAVKGLFSAENSAQDLANCPSADAKTNAASMAACAPESPAKQPAIKAAQSNSANATDAAKPPKSAKQTPDEKAPAAINEKMDVKKPAEVKAEQIAAKQEQQSAQQTSTKSSKKAAAKLVKAPAQPAAKSEAAKERASVKHAEAKPAGKKPEQGSKSAKKPDPSQIASNVAKVQSIKHELGMTDEKALMAALRARKICPRDLGCPNWTVAFKKYAIFED